MKKSMMIMTVTCLSLTAAAAGSRFSMTPEQIAKVFADGVYASMNRETLKKSPNAKISVWVDEAHGSRPGSEVFKAIRDVDGKVRCGTSVYFNNGQPTLEADIECDATKEEQTNLRADKSFVATCPEKYLTYFDKSEGGPGAYCNCPEKGISYSDKAEGGPGFYCAE